ncbi:MAG: 1,6-anhydro-N-acetylmuramyl-L-alanine amidase AmpD [Pseudomonadales bacterium]|nr:1,6-anhydro-N-acetylmuramyl-L-alanine amidase AmpD [Pseudomonadales bacterium]
MAVYDQIWSEAVYRSSPHADNRPDGEVIRLLVIHGISLPAGEFGGDAIDHLFMGTLTVQAYPELASLVGIKVSSHLLIRRTGEVLQYVPFNLRAWHAGNSYWRGRYRCNDFSLGIELEGCDERPYEPIQYRQLERIIRFLHPMYPELREIVGHSDIAPGRKTDPGPAFTWDTLELPGDWLCCHAQGDGL